MFECYIIFLIFAALELFIGVHFNMETGTIITAICTVVTTLLGIRYMFRDILKDTKEKASFKQHVEESEKQFNVCLMAFGKRLDKIDDKLDKIDKRLNAQGESIAKLEGKLEK